MTQGGTAAPNLPEKPILKLKNTMIFVHSRAATPYPEGFSICVPWPASCEMGRILVCSRGDLETC